VSSIDYLNIIEPQVIKIPAGKFLMGSTPGQAILIVRECINDETAEELIKWEEPQHEVELSEYFIGKYPVTNREYQVFVKDTKYRSPEGWTGDQYPEKMGNYPVVNISWEDATAYCKWLSEKTGKTYRLPTEAEWEKAARGTDGRIYPWGDKYDPMKANTIRTNIASKILGNTPVDQFSPQGDSPYGCADMAGNVWEWCADWFYPDEYKHRNNGVKDPQGPNWQRSDRIIRGGACNVSPIDTRCTHRGGAGPGYISGSLGFRIAFSHP